MPHYPAYTTTVVGAHSVPRWYEALDRLVTLGQLSPGDIADAQFRTMQAAIVEQEVAGIDVITGGETHRRTHNRHSPPNAMLNYFWQKIPEFHRLGGTALFPIRPSQTEGQSSRKGDPFDLNFTGASSQVSTLPSASLPSSRIASASPRTASLTCTRVLQQSGWSVVIWNSPGCWS